jgi:predicted dehydrogenase
MHKPEWSSSGPGGITFAANPAQQDGGLRGMQRKGKAHGAKRPGSKRIRYAVVGLGHIAQAAMLPAFRHASRNSELVALVSGETKKLKQLGRRYGVAHVGSYEDFDSMLASDLFDAVYIALPNDKHRDFTLRAARAGKHVLSEKPMAVSARDCEAMIRATRDAGVKLMIAYRLHFERANLEAMQLARSGRLGEPRFFSSDFAMQVSEDNIRLERERGGGPLYDIGIYCINAARFMLDAEPTAVWATATKSRDPRFREVEETLIGVMRFNDERLASFTCSFGAADRSTFTLTGTRGSITLDPAYEYAQGLSYTLRLGEREKTKRFGKSDQFAPELLYFSDCILKNRQPEPSGEEGLADVRIIEAMHRSAQSGRWISLPAQPRKPRPTLRQEKRRPPVPREPRLVDAHGASA